MVDARAYTRVDILCSIFIVDGEVFVLRSSSFAKSGILYWRENGQVNFVLYLSSV